MQYNREKSSADRRLVPHHQRSQLSLVEADGEILAGVATRRHPVTITTRTVKAAEKFGPKSLVIEICSISSVLLRNIQRSRALWKVNHNHNGT